MSLADESNELLMTLMKREVEAGNYDSTGNAVKCAKEIREMLKLKLSAAKFMQQEINRK